VIEKTFLSLTNRGFHRVAYNEWGRRDRAQTVICVHGLTRNGHDFDDLAAALEQERRVACPDIVGRGRSDWLADKQQYTFATYCGDMTALMARLGNDSFDWVGTSMGGMIGKFLAAQPNSPIRRLVINDAGAFVPKSAPQRMLEYVGIEKAFASLAEAESYLRKIYRTFGPLTDAQWGDLTRHSVQRRLEDRAYTLTYDPDIVAPMRSPQDLNLWSVWDEIRCPILLLRGAESDVLTPEIVDDMRRRRPQTEVVEFKGVGHAPALRDRAQIDVIRKWLLA
jgi:pimeloyl-ACP methyl ester carboxylesterase